MISPEELQRRLDEETRIAREAEKFLEEMEARLADPDKTDASLNIEQIVQESAGRLRARGIAVPE